MKNRIKTSIAQKLKKFFGNNLFLKLAALFISFTLWFIVATIDDPVDQKKLQNIKVNLLNTELLDEINKVYEIEGNTDILKSVTFDAPKSVRDSIQPTDIVAEADFEHITEINTVEIKYSCPKYGAQVQNIKGNIEAVKLNIEDKGQKWMNVEYKTIGTVAEGYVIGKVSLGQNRLEVLGPVSAVDTVAKAQVEINVADITEDISASVTVHLLDRNGNEVKRAYIANNMDTTTVEVTVLSTKEVPVEYEAGGTPAEGYMMTGKIDAPIDTIVLAGPSKTLKSLTAVKIKADILNVEGADDDVEFTFDLKDKIPAGLSLADSTLDSVITVKVEIEPLVQKTFEISKKNVEFVGMPENTQYEWFDDKDPEITVEGLNSYVGVMTGATTLGTVDVAAYMEEKGINSLEPGIHTMPIKVKVLDSVTILDTPMAVIRVLDHNSQAQENHQQ